VPLISPFSVRRSIIKPRHSPSDVIPAFPILNPRERDSDPTSNCPVIPNQTQSLHPLWLRNEHRIGLYIHYICTYTIIHGDTDTLDIIASRSIICMSLAEFNINWCAYSKIEWDFNWEMWIQKLGII
jgi:hypothetical protein